MAAVLTADRAHAMVDQLANLRRVANLPDGIDIRQPAGSLPVAEHLQEHVFQIPWFKHYRPAAIEAYAAAVRKVVRCYRELLAGDTGVKRDSGERGLTRRRQ